MQIQMHERGVPTVSIDASNANEAGAVVGFHNDPYGLFPSIFSCQIVVSGGTYTALAVDIEGSHDNVNWFKIGGSTKAAGDLISITGYPLPYVRAKKVSSTTDADEPVVTVTIAA